MGTVAITIGLAVVAIGALANSLRHRNAELAVARDKNYMLEGDLDAVRKSLAEANNSMKVWEKNYADVEKFAIKQEQARLAAEKKLRFAHQRHPKTKSLLPMGTNPDGSKV